jgi:hypothetical protein
MKPPCLLTREQGMPAPPETCPPKLQRRWMCPSFTFLPAPRLSTIDLRPRSTCSFLLFTSYLVFCPIDPFRPFSSLCYRSLGVPNGTAKNTYGTLRTLKDTYGHLKKLFGSSGFSRDERLATFLDLEMWSFPGAWCLELGAYRQSTAVNGSQRHRAKRVPTGICLHLSAVICTYLHPKKISRPPSHHR